MLWKEVREEGGNKTQRGRRKEQGLEEKQRRVRLP